ncbi:MAG: Ig-like domain-containing protein [Acidimicrobiales bacterium]
MMSDTVGSDRPTDVRRRWSITKLATSVVVLGGVMTFGLAAGAANANSSGPSTLPGVKASVARPSVAQTPAVKGTVASPMVTEPPSTVGTDFWTAFGANCPDCDTQVNYIFLSGKTATTATVADPGAGFTDTVHVTPGSIAVVAVNNSEMTTGNGTQNLGVHVTAGAPVSAYGLEDQPYSTDGFTALPDNAIGTDYYALGYDNTVAPGALPSEFDVVGTVNGTKVTIHTDVASPLGAAGTYTETLNVGEVYELIGTLGDDLSGTHITSTHPVAVLAGAQCTNIPNDEYGACNYVAEEMPPTNEWGKNFVTEPLATRTKGDTFRVLADTNGTAVSINGTKVATLAAGAFYQTQLTVASVIETSQPTLVAQYSDSDSYDDVNADPSEALIPPYEQFLNSYTVATAPDTRFTNFLNVVAPKAEVGKVTLNGSAIAASHFTAIGSTGYSGAQLSVATGTYTVTGPQSFGLTVYGFGLTDAYSYPGGYGAGQVANATYLTLDPPAQDALVGHQACLTATVEDQNHKPLSGIGVSFAVTGTNPTNGFATTGANGEAVFCYTGAHLGLDNVTAKVSSLSASATVDFTNQAGYRLTGSDGGLFAFGSSGFHGSVPDIPAIHLAKPVVGVASDATGGGYWLAGADGGVFAFGDAKFYGSIPHSPAIHLAAPIVGIAATQDGGGYWLVGSTGAVYAFGDAKYYGGGGTSIVGIAADATGGGYWLVGSNGGVFSFGAAKYHGSIPGTPSIHLAAPIVGISSDATGGGYWLAGSDGGVFSFGDALFHGSVPHSPAIHLAAPVVGITATPDGAGYWLAGSDGGAFSFGSALFDGSIPHNPAIHLVAPVVGIAGVPPV